jgi:hypothetical protein
MKLGTDVSTQTVGLYFPSQRQMNQQNEEIDRKLTVLKEMRERRPVVLTAVSPGKGYWRRQMEHITEHLKAHAANDPGFRALIGEPRMGKLLSATVREDGYELCLSVNFALRGGGSALADDTLFSGGGPPTGRRSSLTRFASQDSLAESTGNVTSRSRTSGRRPSSRQRKRTVARKKPAASQSCMLTEEDKKLLKEIGKNGEGRPEEVEQLVDEGANPCCISNDGLPALHVAVIAGHGDVVPILVQAGADVNEKGPSGNTALHEAVTLGPVAGSVIEALLGCGATLTKKNDKGDTPYDIAVKSGHDVVANKLTSFMGQSTLGKLSKPRGSTPGPQDM